MTVKLDRFKLEWLPKYDELALVHIDCGEIVHTGLLLDNWSLRFWVDYARKHKCSDNAGR